MEQQQSRSDGHTSPAGQQDRKPYQPPAIT